MALELIALWKGLPFVGKALLGIAGAYVAHRTYEAAAETINDYLDEHYPNVTFRLKASIVEWGVRVVKAAITAALANDPKGEFKKQYEHLTVNGMIELCSHVVASTFSEEYEREATADEIKIIAHGVTHAFAHA